MIRCAFELLVQDFIQLLSVMQLILCLFIKNLIPYSGKFLRGGKFRESAKKRFGFIFVSLIFTNQPLHMCTRVRTRAYISGMHTRRTLITV